MIVEFRVRNFRSIRDDNKISFVASSDNTNQNSIVETNNKSIPRLLKAAVIYGANAGGKSNLIRAIGFMRNMVAASFMHQPDAKLNMQPFKIDTKKINEPTEFEITILKNNVRYQYGFEMTSERITEEWLLVYKTPKPQTWFIRKFNQEKNIDQYEFSAHLTGDKKSWIDAARPNVLFLSTAAFMQSELLKPIYNWITNDIVTLGNGNIPDPHFSSLMLQNSQGKMDIFEFLRSADTGISDIVLETRKRVTKSFSFGLVGAGEIEEKEEDVQVPLFLHSCKNGSAKFDLQDESDGTQKMFSYSALFLDVLKQGKSILIDELDNSLHPHLVRHLVSLFNSKDTNPNGAQLFFSTHDTNLLDGNLLRRDQIWFAEKDENHATVIYPLTEFSPRNNDAFERGYLTGRYGGLPFIDEIKA